MSVRLRFKRVGRPHEFFYRLVAIDRRQARDAEPIETMGTFDPRNIKKPDALKVERLRYWVSVGATPTDTVRHVLKKVGVWDQVKPGAPAAPKS